MNKLQLLTNGNSNKIELKSNKYLLCSNCLKRIPNITIINSEGRFELNVSCFCSKEVKHISLSDFMTDMNILSSLNPNKKCYYHNHTQAEKYCHNCSFWLCQECLMAHSLQHIFLTNEINIICHQHKKDFYSYCLSCHQNICIDCYKTHQNHCLSEIKQIQDYGSLYSFNMISFERIMLKKKEITEEFVAKIQSEINDLKKKINQLKIIQKEVISYYKINQHLNQLLIDFYQCLFNTAAISNNHPSYQISRLFNSIKPNETFITTDFHNNNEEILQKLNNDFKNNYILIQKDVTNKCIATLNDHDNSVGCLIQLNTGQLVSGSADKAIKLWSFDLLKCTATLTGHTNYVACLLQLNDKHLASGSWDNSIKIWDVNRLKCITTLVEHHYSVRCLCMLNNKHFASGSYDKTIKIWNALSYKCIMTINEHVSYVRCLININNKEFASGSADKTIKLWLIDKDKQICVKTLVGHEDCVRCLIVLHDGKLCSGSYDNTIRIWNMKTYNCLTILREHKGYIYSLIQLNDGNIISGSDDKTMKLWNKMSLECIMTFTDHSGEIYSLIQLSNGYLASCSYDNTIKIWDI